MSFELAFRSFPAPAGPLRIAEVTWDSATFGLPMYELRCPEDPAALEAHLPGLLASLGAGRAMVAVKVPCGAAVYGSVLARQGFYPVETLLELHHSLERFKPLVARMPAGLRLRPAVEADEPALESLARSAFEADRFHQDPHLPRDRADERFAQWIRRGMAAGDPVFVFEDGREIFGFYHVQETPPGSRSVRLSLAAMAAGRRKLGFGALMYQAVLLECRARGFAVAWTHVSAANLDVLNLFARLGFAVRNPVVTFHWHGGLPGRAVTP